MQRHVCLRERERERERERDRERERERERERDVPTRTSAVPAEAVQGLHAGGGGGVHIFVGTLAEVIIYRRQQKNQSTNASYVEKVFISFGIKVAHYANGSPFYEPTSQYGDLNIL